MLDILEKLKYTCALAGHEQIKNSIKKYYEIEKNISLYNKTQDGNPKNGRQLEAIMFFTLWKHLIE